MPRPRRAGEDFWAWAAEQSGNFTVRSAYRSIMEKRFSSEEIIGNSTAGEETWKALWKLNVLPKIRVFWWRVVKGFLPSYGELRRRHVMQLSNCPMCGHEEESLFHSFLQCDHAKRFWEAASDCFGISIPKLHPQTWTRDMLDVSIISKQDAAIAISVIWAIWSNRNKYTHEEYQYQPLRSMELIEELVRSLEIPVDSQCVVQNTKPRWKPPDDGWFKLNTDGAVDSVRRIAGAGIVVRDHKGDMIAARCVKYEHICDPFTIELLACRDAVVLAQDLGLSKIIIETDCQMVQRLWSSEEVHRSSGAQLYREMKDSLSAFQGFQLHFAGRSGNTAAHLCAKEAISIVDVISNFLVIPGFLVDVIRSEKTPSIE